MSQVNLKPEGEQRGGSRAATAFLKNVTQTVLVALRPLKLGVPLSGGWAIEVAKSFRTRTTSRLKPGLRTSAHFAFVLLVCARAVESRFARGMAEQPLATARLENRAVPKSDHPLEAGQGGQHSKAEALAQTDRSHNRPESNQTGESSAPDRVRASQQGVFHFNQKPAANHQTGSASTPNLHLPVLKKPAEAEQKRSATSKMEPQRSQAVRSAAVKSSPPMVDAIHSRILAPASIGGPSSKAKNNAGLKGLNGTGMKHKP